MRKLPSKYESHLDNIIYIPVEAVSPFMRNVSPNMITTIGLIFDIVGFYMCYLNKFVLGLLFFIVGYFFDCLDGYVARQYNKVTVFGDYYDHFTDVIKIIGILYFSYKLNSNLFLKLLPVYVILFLFMNIHLDLQEVYYNKRKESASLSFLSPIVKYFHGNNTSNLRFSRFFGCGNVIMLVLAMFLYIALNRNFEFDSKPRKKDLNESIIKKG